MTNIPLCKDCKFYSKRRDRHICGWKIDPVTGKPGGFANLEREYKLEGLCGPNGKHFELRPITTKKPSYWGKVMRIFKYNAKNED